MIILTQNTEEYFAPPTTYSHYISAEMFDTVDFCFDRQLYTSILNDVKAPNAKAFIAGECFSSSEAAVDVFIYTDIDGAREDVAKEELLSFINPAVHEQMSCVTQQFLRCCLMRKLMTVKHLRKRPVTVLFLDRSIKDFASLLRFFQVEAARIAFEDGKFFLSDWFVKGGPLVPADKLPAPDLIDRYRKRGLDGTVRWINNRQVIVDVNEL